MREENSVGHWHRQRGQTLVEYVMAGGLIALVGLGALVFLSGSLQSMLPDLLNRIFGDAPVTVAHAPSAEPLGTMPTAPSGIPGTVKITLANGETVTLPGFPGSTSQAVETAGINGATKTLLANMQTFIDKLETAGDLTPEQVNMLRDLANAGHEVAEVERMLEEAAIASGADINAYRNMTLTYKGETHTVTEWGNLIGYKGEKIDTFAKNPFDRSKMDYADSPIGIFSLRYEEALKKGAMDDPAIKTVVTYLASEILLIAGMAEYQVDNMITTDDLASGAASKLTHLDSGSICNTGGGEDTGVYCPQ